MTATAVPTVKEQEMIPNGLVESASVNSIADFVPSTSDESEANKKEEVNDFINTFICHLIFYLVFCISLVLHIFIDLGFGSFVKKLFLPLSEIAKNSFVVKNPAFA
tara:strand:- start:194 stop:511 length:318 start_codon:yes stop_codon:yes gene_type:complete